MVKLQLTILFAILTVAFAGNIRSQSTSVSYKKLEATELVLKKGQQVNFPLKGGRCKPVGQLDVLGCSGKYIILHFYFTSLHHGGLMITLFVSDLL